MRWKTSAVKSRLTVTSLRTSGEKEKVMSIVEDALSKASLAKELLQFFWHNKWWWLAPMITLLLAFGVLIILAESSAIAPFIYTLF
jgi:hypothetical protein